MTEEKIEMTKKEFEEEKKRHSRSSNVLFIGLALLSTLGWLRYADTSKQISDYYEKKYFESDNLYKTEQKINLSYKNKLNKEKAKQDSLINFYENKLEELSK